jgi:1,4-dihydroxy-2-naphthoate octaprenyltransferase
MNDTEGRPSPLAVWIMAARPRTLPASASGVIVGSALAALEGAFRPLPALAALLVALCLQIASNLANDVFDFERGTDAKRSVGPTRVTQAGLLTPRQVKAGLVAVIVVAAFAGLWLASVAGWWLLLVGAAAIVSAVVYTAGPFPLSHLGLGDLFVFLFFGLAAVVGSYFVQAGHLGAAAWAMSLPPGLIIVAILVVNNLRDIDEDREAGKRTLAVRFGAGFTKGEYLFCLAVAYLAVPIAAAFGLVPWWAMASWLSVPLAVKNARIVLTKNGAALNAALGGTGMLAFAWAALFAAGLAVCSLAGILAGGLPASGGAGG